MGNLRAEFKICQSEKYEGSDWWSWSVWIEGDEPLLDSVKSVEWTLHPTFTNPVRKSRDRAGKFRLDAGGWGTFPIRALVEMRDGNIVRLRHQLSLTYPDGMETTSEKGGHE
jgi:transcription initiation factor IIF auxiliary subunit